MNKSLENIKKYYGSIGSRLGYQFVTWETKHFGFYPDKKANISEREAQIQMMDLAAKKLEVKSTDTILDAGCGYGTTTCYIAKKYHAKTVGVDINGFEIQRAKINAEKEKLSDRVSFKLMDYSNTDFKNNQFDGIYTLETLSHSLDINKTLKEFLRILKSGGRVAFFEYTVAPDKDFSPWQLKMLNLGIEGTAVFALKKFKHGRFADVLTKAGFLDAKEQDVTANFLPSVHRLKKIAQKPYYFIKLLGLQKYFINSTIAVEWYDLVKDGLIRYGIFTARKPL